MVTFYFLAYVVGMYTGVCSVIILLTICFFLSFGLFLNSNFKVEKKKHFTIPDGFIDLEDQ